MEYADIVLGKRYKDKQTGFTGIAIMKAEVYNGKQPVVRLQGGVVGGEISVHSIPLYEFPVGDVEETEDSYFIKDVEV